MVETWQAERDGIRSGVGHGKAWLRLRRTCPASLALPSALRWQRQIRRATNEGGTTKTLTSFVLPGRKAFLFGRRGHIDDTRLQLECPDATMDD